MLVQRAFAVHLIFLDIFHSYRLSLLPATFRWHRCKHIQSGSSSGTPSTPDFADAPDWYWYSLMLPAPRMTVKSYVHWRAFLHFRSCVHAFSKITSRDCNLLSLSILVLVIRRRRRMICIARWCYSDLPCLLSLSCFSDLANISIYAWCVRTTFLFWCKIWTSLHKEVACAFRKFWRIP